MLIGAVPGYRWEPVAGMTAENLLGEPDRAVRNLIDTTQRGNSKGAVKLVRHGIKVGSPTEAGGYLNGLWVRKGRVANVPTPMNEAMDARQERVECREPPWNISTMCLVPKPRCGV